VRTTFAPGVVDHVDHPELAVARDQRRREPRGRRLAGVEPRGRGGGQRAQARVGRRDAHGGAGGADDRARGVGGQLQDLLDGERRVDRHRGLRERAQLLDVGVLEPRDLLHLAVAAMDALERRQALAQEVRRRLQRLLGQRRPGQRGADGAVVDLGEVEHAQVLRHRLAAEVVRRAERLLAAIGQIGRERLGVPRRKGGWSGRGALRGPHVGGKPTRCG
jgi:hypothetical protein